MREFPLCLDTEDYDCYDCAFVDDPDVCRIPALLADFPEIGRLLNDLKNRRGDSLNKGGGGE